MYHLGKLLIEKAINDDNLQMLDRPIKLLEEALKYIPETNEPRLGGYFFLILGEALFRIKQNDKAAEIFQVQLQLKTIRCYQRHKKLTK